MKNIITLLFFLIIVLNVLPLHAAKIILNSGDELEATVLRQGSGYIVLDMSGIEVTLYRNQYKKMLSEDTLKDEVPENKREFEGVNRIVKEGALESLRKEGKISDKRIFLLAIHSFRGKAFLYAGECMEIFKKARKEKSENVAVVKSITEYIRALEGMMQEMGSLTVPAGGHKLRNAFLNYTHKLLKFQKFILRQILQTKKKDKKNSFKGMIKEIKEAEKRLDVEYNRFVKE